MGVPALVMAWFIIRDGPPPAPHVVTAIGPVLSFAAYDAMRDEMGSFARRLYSIDCLEYVLIQGHRETVAVYREVR